MIPAGTPADFGADVYAPFTRSRADESREDLQARFHKEGYLYFPRALSDRVEPLLRDMLAVLAPHIHWDENLATPVLAGEPFFESDPFWDAVYPDIQALESLHQLFHGAEAQRLMRLVAGEETFVYPMKMARIAAPRKIGFETPPHQDAFSHHAGPTMAGIWIALHDADESMGRLTILPGSHAGGVRPVFEAKGVGGVQCEIYPDETLWHVSDVGAGDVIIFHSQTVHRAQPNIDKRRVRLSVDTRFCDYGAPVFSTNLEPHHGWRIPGLDWEYVYRHWSSPELCYYWREYPALF
ncbi:phytanoyl-CoA dioxygenase family protein [Congregibacter litoralis]|uniref:Protein involved in biosynthesis of mitomycin antibiotics/polyketide fumonisin n=1 Tax=Congregibacter litoralis KT71 TaxID=314285 RepID=A4AA71_9GAMM|nr:phytanoyl-CoA dioxygenase family protein [Congregibacter litoralis]EAQ96948.1 Protein involved in biosynthesis of mitomycin antibiotics/polyketide fumonisin [Congregibacter litoralis KT71]